MEIYEMMLVFVGFFLIYLGLIEVIVRFKFNKSTNSNVKAFVRRYINRLICVDLHFLFVSIIFCAFGLFIALIFIFATFIFVIVFATSKSVVDYRYTKKIILENIYDCNDFVKIAGFIGKVENISDTSTTIVALDGSKLIIANSLTKDVINLSSDLKIIDILFPIKKDKDVEEAIKLLEDKLPEIIETYPQIIEGPSVAGIEEINDDSIILSVIAKTTFDQSQEVKRGILVQINKILKDLK